MGGRIGECSRCGIAQQKEPPFSAAPAIACSREVSPLRLHGAMRRWLLGQTEVSSNESGIKFSSSGRPSYMGTSLSRAPVQRQRMTVPPRGKEGNVHNDIPTMCDHLAGDGCPFTVDTGALVTRLDGDILEVCCSLEHCDRTKFERQGGTALILNKQ